MSYRRVSALTLLALWAAFAGCVCTARQVQAGGGPLAMPVRCTGATICDRTLGIALNPPVGWTLVPPGQFPAGTLAFWTRAPGTQEPSLHLVIDSLGQVMACSDAQAVAAVATALSHTAPSPGRTTRRSSTVGGAPAIIISGLPGSATYGLTIVIAHHGLVYRLDTFGSKALTPAQRYALTSLHFIARRGPFPTHADPAIARILRTCATTPVSQLSPGTIVRLTKPSPASSMITHRALAVRLLRPIAPW